MDIKIIKDNKWLKEILPIDKMNKIEEKYIQTII